MRKLLYVCEAESGGILEYAIRQSEAIAREGVEVHFLCKPSFPVERLADGIVVQKFVESRMSSVQRRGLAGKILRVLRMISDLRSEAKQVDQLAEELASSPNSELTTIEHGGRCEMEHLEVGPKGEGVGTSESKATESTEEEKAATLKSEKLKHNFDPLISQIDTDKEADTGLRPGSQAGTEFSNTFTSELARDSENASRTHSAIGPASESTTRAPLPVTSRNLGAAEVVVLFDCYKEYFAPFWVEPLQRLAKKGLVMGTIAHDPVRDFVVGPLWWHRWSVRLGYSFVQHVFVHDDTPVDFGGKRPEGIEVHHIPFGAYPLCPPRVAREEVRNRFGFAHSDIVFFAFGQIRDGKNLDLFLRAMTKLPENVKLLVAGKGHSGSSKPPEFYQNLARELGVAERCRFEIRRVPDEEVGELFNAIDFTLLTYSAKFRSMSAVLASALTARKPVLASSGLGPLKTMVEKYELGVFVKPDDPEEILRGATKLVPSSATGKCEFELQPAWDKYEQENSWEENARRVRQAFES
jgi:glycosyltransferase involved in cell wall biosynthesis